MKIKISTALDKGERDNNEDALVYCADLCQAEWQQDGMEEYVLLGDCGSIAVVADGMGGANAGEVASSISIQTIKEVFTPDRASAAIKGGEDTIKSLLSEAVKQADAAILQHMANNVETQGMGTTIVICWITREKAFVAWCGDSRCYSYLPTEKLKPLTRDHSLVQEMMDKGEITAEEAFSHPDSNVITRGLGDFGCDVRPDVVVHPIGQNEVLLLCSDGLCGYCEDKSIQAIMDNSYTDIDQCCNDLLQLTLGVGGYDNIAIIAISLIDDKQESPNPISFFGSIKRRINRFLTS